MAFDLGSLLQQYLGGGSSSQADQHFDQAAMNTPPDILSGALASMFRSDQTPPFGQMAGQLFGQSNPNQQAGMLNAILTKGRPCWARCSTEAAADPAAVSVGSAACWVNSPGVAAAACRN